MKKVFVQTVVLLCILGFVFMLNLLVTPSYGPQKVVAVESIRLWSSFSVIAFLVLTVLKPNYKNFFLLPFLAAVWLLLSDIVIRVFQITVIHRNPKEGDYIWVSNSLLEYISPIGEIISGIIILTFIGIIPAVIGFSMSYGIRKLRPFTTSHNTA